MNTDSRTSNYPDDLIIKLINKILPKILHIIKPLKSIRKYPSSFYWKIPNAIFCVLKEKKMKEESFL